MIRLSRLSGQEFVLNSELIESIEATPDTLITLTSGRKLMVREPVDAVVARVLEARAGAAGPAAADAPGSGTWT